MGRNGTGKTTLLKSLLRNATGYIEDTDKEFTIDGGRVKWGHEVTVGYFAQDHSESIVKGTTVDRVAASIRTTGDAGGAARAAGPDALQRRGCAEADEALSGGEAARLIFCRLMLQRPNILVLDEPTNHLDLESINALNIALQKYEGTVLLVTHDHDVIDEVATRIWHFELGTSRTSRVRTRNIKRTRRKKLRRTGLRAGGIPFQRLHYS